MKTECATLETRKQRGRPRKNPLKPKISEIRRKERIAKFGGLVSRLGELPKFIEKMRPPPQTICITLSIPSLVLIDLYIEFAAEKTLLANKIHHGTIIDSLVDRLREDSDFSSWLSISREFRETDFGPTLSIQTDG